MMEHEGRGEIDGSELIERGEDEETVRDAFGLDEKSVGEKKRVEEGISKRKKRGRKEEKKSADRSRRRKVTTHGFPSKHHPCTFTTGTSCPHS